MKQPKTGMTVLRAVVAGIALLAAISPGALAQDKGAAFQGNNLVDVVQNPQ